MKIDKLLGPFAPMAGVPLKVEAGAVVFKTEFQGAAFLDKNSRVGPDVTIGRYCSLGENSSIIRATIGNYCAIGQRVAINPFSHPTNWLSTHEFQYRDDSYDWVSDYRDVKRLSRTPDMLTHVTIGSDVWIGHGAQIIGNITVGHGAVIAAGAIVTKDVPPYAVVGGVPAGVIKYRHPETVIRRLLDVQWWDLPLKQLSGLPFRDVDACLVELERMRGIVVNNNRVNNG